MIEWFAILGLLAASFLFYIHTSSGVRERTTRSAANSTQSAGVGQTSALPDLGERLEGEGMAQASPPLRPSPSSRVQRRQSRARLKRMSVYQRMENDARIRLYMKGNRIAVMARRPANGRGD